MCWIATKNNQFLSAFSVLSLMVFLLLRGDASTTAKEFPAGLISIQGEDLPGKYNGAEIGDFAVSPDNTKIAVEFEVGEGDKKLGVWLGEFEIATKKLIAKVHLTNPVSETITFIAVHHETMKYSPDGSQIIVQAGRDLYAFDSVTLNLRYSVSYPDLAEGSASEVYGRRFAISSDGSTLAVFFGQSINPQRLGLVRLFKAKTGEQLARWSVSVPIQSLSLSPDGKQLLVTALNPKDTTDILLLDSVSGLVIKGFESGFGTHLLAGAAVNAMFVDADDFVATPGSFTDEKGRYLGHGLKIIDSRTGKVTRELTYEKFSPSQVWVSARDSTLATLNLWMSPWRRRSMEGSHSHAQLLFFRLNEGNPFCVLGPIPENKERPRQSGFIRFSPDLGLMGLFINRKLTVYSVPECNERSGTRAVKEQSERAGRSRSRVATMSPQFCKTKRAKVVEGLT